MQTFDGDLWVQYDERGLLPLAAAFKNHALFRQQDIWQGQGRNRCLSPQGLMVSSAHAARVPSASS
jgi:hypothetical protein